MISGEGSRPLSGRLTMYDPKNFLVFKEAAPQEGDTRWIEQESVPGGIDNPIDPATGQGVVPPDQISSAGPKSLETAKELGKRDYREGVPMDNPGGGMMSEEEVQSY